MSQPGPDPSSTQTAAATGAKPTYEQASGRVEEIIRRLDSGDASLSETLALVKEGKAMIELCANELGEVGAALEELRLDDLVSRLERESSS
ncbi:MAG TPA: exodeoxyribonuclease VII small subunit [Solirubrobacteraceae bacterium]|jgi:exodeoxyribonuclease VII small subunit|nr:exodeoxyribonuclease VII small subunit [Solirubrobacteraceae bacterium]